MLTSKVTTALLKRVNNVALMQVANKHHEFIPLANREIVGWGVNGMPQYVDRVDFPFPAIRFKEIKGELIPLKEKEKGNWKNLTKEEKKALYRASFCQTFSELDSPTGEWKSILGITLFLSSFAIWAMLLLKKYVFPPLPESFSEESRRAQLRRLLDLKQDIVTGISSKWDYEKDDWKK